MVPSRREQQHDDQGEAGDTVARPGGGLRASIVNLLQYKRIGVPAAVLTNRVGANELSRKISILCGYVPPTVEVIPPANFAGGRRFLMGGAGGLDPVARANWWCGWQGYEKPFPDLFASCSRSSRLVLDVGAYSGFYSMVAATCSPEARAIAFEPYPVARGLLEANLASNRDRFGGRISVVPMAAGESSGMADLFVPPTTTGLLESASSLRDCSRSRWDRNLEG